MLYALSGEFESEKAPAKCQLHLAPLQAFSMLKFEQFSIYSEKIRCLDVSRTVITIRIPSESDSALVLYAPGGAFEKVLARAKISVGQDSDLLCENGCK